MQIFIHLVFCHFLLLEFLFLSFFYSKKPSAFWQFVLEAVEAAWGQKSIKWLIRHKFPLLRTATSLISWHKIQNWGHTRSLKCLKTSPMTLYFTPLLTWKMSLDPKHRKKSNPHADRKIVRKMAMTFFAFSWKVEKTNINLKFKYLLYLFWKLVLSLN